ncbi:MAG TPA: DUF721 domain-containing protein [Bryobacteraceae bacterium]|nr:DUF721 domain-containing protein [Bryobacteraceae bacterium]
MERASRVVGKLGGAGEEKLAQAAWPLAVGRRLASRTRPVHLAGTRLIINVEDAVWQSQLFTLREQILNRLEHVLGRRLVTALEFRVAIPRAGVSREELPARAPDEADGITDPVLRSLYRASRKRAPG